MAHLNWALTTLLSGRPPVGDLPSDVAYCNRQRPDWEWAIFEYPQILILIHVCFDNLSLALIIKLLQWVWRTFFTFLVKIIRKLASSDEAILFGKWTGSEFVSAHVKDARWKWQTRRRLVMRVSAHKGGRKQVVIPSMAHCSAIVCDAGRTLHQGRNPSFRRGWPRKPA